MRLSTVLVALLLLCSTALARRPPAPPQPVQTGPILLQKKLNKALADVAFIDGMIRSLKGNPRAVAEIQQRLHRLKKRLTRLIAVVPATIPRVVDVRPPAPRVMPPAAFESLLKSVKKEAFSGGKLQIVATAASNNFFTVAQVARLLTAFSFSGDKLKCVGHVADRIVDRQNLFQLIEAFTFDSEKKKLRKILRM